MSGEARVQDMSEGGSVFSASSPAPLPPQLLRPLSLGVGKGLEGVTQIASSLHTETRASLLRGKVARKRSTNVAKALYKKLH